MNAPAKHAEWIVLSDVPGKPLVIWGTECALRAVSMHPLRFDCESITNDAEYVLAHINAAGALKGGRRLFYFDTFGDLGEIVHRDGVFAGFAEGPFRRRQGLESVAGHPEAGGDPQPGRGTGTPGPATVSDVPGRALVDVEIPAGAKLVRVEFTGHDGGASFVNVYRSPGLPTTEGSGAGEGNRGEAAATAGDPGLRTGDSAPPAPPSVAARIPQLRQALEQAEFVATAIGVGALPWREHGAPQPLEVAVRVLRLFVNELVEVAEAHERGEPSTMSPATLLGHGEVVATYGSTAARGGA